MSRSQMREFLYEGVRQFIQIESKMDSLQLQQKYMIAENPNRGIFRKTITGFMPKHIPSKMAFQCLPLPESSASILKTHKSIEHQEAVSSGRLRVSGRQLHKSISHRRRIKSNNGTSHKTRIKTIKIVMDNPEKIVKKLIIHNQSEEKQERVQIKTPKEIITSINRTLANSQREARSREVYRQDNYDRQIHHLESLDNMQYYEQMILENPALFKKIMVIYNSSKRQADREQSKVTLKKVTRREEEVSRPNQLKLSLSQTPEMKKNAVILQWHQFQLAVSLTNKVLLLPPSEGLYKAYICKGNNGLLVKALVKSRPWWSIRGRGEMDSCNLIWTEWKRTKATKQLPEVAVQCNQGEPPCEINGSKHHKLRSLRLAAEKKLAQMKKLCLPNDDLWRHYNPSGGSEHHFSKRLLDSKPEELSQFTNLNQAYSLKAMEKEQRSLNHLPGCLHLHSKKLLFRNLKLHYQGLNRDVFEVVPVTFHIEKGSEDPEFSRFCQYFEESAKKGKGKGKSPNIWICKPGENSNRGNGISVLSSLSDIKELANLKCSSPHRSLIIQKYFQHPFLYHKRKFDIRCFMLVTTVNGILKGYWYEEGYLRTASKEFTLKHLENKFIHLTNDAIQKKSEEYGKHQNCNKISYAEFEKYLEANHSEEKHRFSEAVEGMKTIATDLIQAVAGQLNPERKEHCFEIFGLDFMLDSKMKPYLIEANSNPCITVDGSVLAKIIPAMLENVIRVAIDPVFPPPVSETMRSKYHFSNSFEVNRLELIYDSYHQSAGSVVKEQEQEEEDEELPNEQDQIE